MYCSSTIPSIADTFFAHDVYAINVKTAVSSAGPTFANPNLRAELGKICVQFLY